MTVEFTDHCFISTEVSFYYVPQSTVSFFAKEINSNPLNFSNYVPTCLFVLKIL